MNKYGQHTKFLTQPGQADALLGLLLEAATAMNTVSGCLLYMVSKDPQQPDSVLVTEAWDSREDHDNALKIEGAKEMIAKALPFLQGMPEATPLEVWGGKGIG